MLISEREKLEIEQLWRRFITFEFDNEEMLLNDFTNFEGQTIFPKGTYRSEIWDYFNRIYPDGIKKLIEIK